MTIPYSRSKHVLAPPGSQALCRAVGERLSQPQALPSVGSPSRGGGCTGSEKSSGTRVTGEGSEGSGAQSGAPSLACSVVECFPKEGVLTRDPED